MEPNITNNQNTNDSQVNVKPTAPELPKQTVATAFENPKDRAKTSDLRTKTRKIAVLHFFYVFALAVQLIAYDAGKFITPEVTMRRWIANGVLLTITALVWYVAKDLKGQAKTMKRLIALLVVADIAMASTLVYMTRGMASRAVALYVIPMIVAGVLARKSAVMATAAICIAAYIGTAVSYFVLNFNEGYKLELYGETGFYSAIFVLVGLMLWVFIRPPKKNS